MVSIIKTMHEVFINIDLVKQKYIVFFKNESLTLKKYEKHVCFLVQKSAKLVHCKQMARL